MSVTIVPTPPASQRAFPEPADANLRRFRSPSGREWSAYLLTLPPWLVRSGGRAAVLRFEAKEIALDLRDWPDDWATRDDEALVDLLRQATTPNYIPSELQ